MANTAHKNKHWHVFIFGLQSMRLQHCVVAKITAQTAVNVARLQTYACKSTGSRKLEVKVLKGLGQRHQETTDRHSAPSSPNAFGSGAGRWTRNTLHTRPPDRPPGIQETCTWNTNPETEDVEQWWRDPQSLSVHIWSSNEATQFPPSFWQLSWVYNRSLTKLLMLTLTLTNSPLIGKTKRGKRALYIRVNPPASEHEWVGEKNRNVTEKKDS